MPEHAHSKTLISSATCRWFLSFFYRWIYLVSLCRPHTVPVLHEDDHTSIEFSISCEVAYDFGTFKISHNMFTRGMLESMRCHKNYIRLYKNHVRFGSSHARYDRNNTRTHHGGCTTSCSHHNTIYEHICRDGRGNQIYIMGKLHDRDIGQSNCQLMGCINWGHCICVDACLDKCYWGWEGGILYVYPLT